MKKINELSPGLKKRYRAEENVSSADKKPEMYIDPQGKRKVRMVKVDREVIKKEGYIGSKGEKGRDYHNAGTFDKETAYSHAKKHNGVVHKDPSGKYLVKHGRGKNVSEGWRSGGGGHRSPFKAAYEEIEELRSMTPMRDKFGPVNPKLKTSDYPKGTSMSAQKFKDSQKKMSKQRALSTKDYPKGTSMSATAWKNRQEEVEVDEAIDFRKAFMDIQSYAKKNGGMDKTDFEKVAYYVKAIGDHRNTPNVANKAFMLMKKHIAGLDTDVRDGIHMLLKKHGMIKNGRIVQESIELDEGWRSGGGGHRSPFKNYASGGSSHSDPFKAARRDAKYKELSHEYEDEKKLARLKQMRKTQQQKKEETVAELSKDTLSSYKKKATQSAIKHHIDSQSKDPNPDSASIANKRIRGLARLKKVKTEKSDPCWDDYEMVGMKKKNGKSVPNCIPKESVVSELTDKEREEIARIRAKKAPARDADGRSSVKRQQKKKDAAANPKKAAAPKPVKSKPKTTYDDKADLHPIVQLRKVVDTKGIHKPVFHKGKTGKVSADDAHHALKLYDKLPVMGKRQLKIRLAKGGPAAVKQAANAHRSLGK